MAIYTSNFLSRWHWLKVDDKILLIESMTSQLDKGVEASKLIQGDSGTHVMAFKGKTWNTSLQSSVLVQVPQARVLNTSSQLKSYAAPFNSAYRDIFDLLITDLNDIRQFLFNNSKVLQPKNLLTSAQITIDNGINVSLSYNASFSQKFQEIRYISGETAPSLDFIARTAKNYDCKFYVSNDPTRAYSIFSGSVSVNISYAKMFLLNFESDFPIYSPQGYEFSGSFVIPLTDFNLLKTRFEAKDNQITIANFSILVGTRYLKLGQATIEDSIKFSMGNSLNTAEISFKGFARI